MREWSHTLDVVGLGFRLKRETRVNLAMRAEKSGGIKGIRLVREPDNEYDPNAIAVFLPKRLMGGAQIGYLRRPSAELLARKLDAGEMVIVKATLLSLRAEDDLKEGPLDVLFRDK